MISANQWGVVIENGGSGNLLEGNEVGTDITGQRPLGNSVDGILVNDASMNTIGGTGAGQGNTIAFNLDGRGQHRDGNGQLDPVQLD